MVRLFVFLGGILVLLLAAAIVTPFFIDWSKYKEQFEQHISQVMGVPIAIGGDIDVRLAPFPSITASKVSIGGTQHNNQQITIEQLSMQAEIVPMLSGELKIFEMQLVKPQADISIRKSGEIIGLPDLSNGQFSDRISFERVGIVDGQVKVAHAQSGGKYRLDAINVKFSAKAFAGPWRGEGALTVQDQLVKVQVTTGVVREDKVGLRLKLAPANLPGRVDFNGEMKFTEGALTYAGTFVAVQMREENVENNGESADNFSLSISDEDEENPLVSARGQFSFDHKLLSLDQFRLSYGDLEDPYQVDGSAYLDIGESPRFLVSATGNKLTVFEHDNRGQDSGTGAGLNLDQLRHAFAYAPRVSIPGTVDVSLPVLQFGTTTARNVELGAWPKDNGWQISSFSAQLPGRSRVEGSGFLSLGEDVYYTGRVTVAVRQLSGAAKWLFGNVDNALRRVGKGGLSANVYLSPERQYLNDIELIFGESRFEGQVDRRIPLSGVGNLRAEFKVGAVDKNVFDMLASIGQTLWAQDILSHDAIDAALETGPLVINDIQIGSADLSVRVKDGEIDIDRLALTDIAGANLSGTGNLVPNAGQLSGELDLSIVAPDALPLLEVLKKKFPNPVFENLISRAKDYTGLFEDAQIDGVAQFRLNGKQVLDITGSARGALSGTSFTITHRQNSASAGSRETRFENRLSMNGSELAPILALAGLSALPIDVGQQIALSIDSKGTLQKAIEFRVRAQSQQDKLEVAATYGVIDALVSGTAKVSTQDLLPYLIVTGGTIPDSGVIAFSFETPFEYHKNKLLMAGLSGRVNQTDISGVLEVERNDDDLILAGQINSQKMHLLHLIETVLGAQGLSFEKNSGIWPTAPFDPIPPLNVSGVVDFDVDKLLIGQKVAITNARFSAAREQDTVSVSDLSGQLFGGFVSGALSAQNASGIGSVRLEFDGADLNGQQLAEAVGGPGVEGSVDISANLEGSGENIEDIAKSLTGSGELGWTNGRLDGLNPAGLRTIVAYADQHTNQDDLSSVANHVRQNIVETVRAGQLPVEHLEFALTVAGGILRLPSLKIEVEGAKLEADVELDASQARMTAKGSLAYNNVEEQIVGATPRVEFTAKGAIGDIEVTYNSEPFVQYLTQRALEREQARVEKMQARLIEKRRLRREASYYLQRARDRQKQAQSKQKAQELMAEQYQLLGPVRLGPAHNEGNAPPVLQ